MKNLKLLAIVLGMLSLSSCNRNEEEQNTQQPNKENQAMRSLGAVLVDEKTYDSFAKADIEALTMKFKGKSAIAAAATIPSSYSIPNTPPILNQGQEGSCVAFATAYAAASTLEHNFKGITNPRSPEYVYNQIKLSDCPNGTYISRGLNLIKDQGVCSWNEMPYTDVECSTQPNTTQKSAASTHKFTTWATVDNTNIDNVKTLLSMNLPIIIAVTVDGSFDNLSSANNWIWKSHSGAVRGKHAVCIVGYDDAKQAFKVQNSWGTTWGDHGFFWINYAFFAKTTEGAINESYVAYVQ
ncbi:MULTISPECIES: C1 family peptidase [unclassified Chryseobacterium]|uniref:C1 family peptidase n=1 Tax=unclassified Chryseobacterium TaxID=2593645 RepID=UPI002852FC5C|nr:C1 family peptidase [Chryseobacterium sp. CFS7]MDR4892209.1 C1 family peptidase [Chryseobacterium sp. CFS7]